MYSYAIFDWVYGIIYSIDCMRLYAKGLQAKTVGSHLFVYYTVKYIDCRAGLGCRHTRVSPVCCWLISYTECASIHEEYASSRGVRESARPISS